MQKYTYDIVDSEGYVLLTVTTQFVASEDAAYDSLIPILDAVRVQYGDSAAALSDPYGIPGIK